MGGSAFARVLYAVRPDVSPRDYPPRDKADNKTDPEQGLRTHHELNFLRGGPALSRFWCCFVSFRGSVRF